MIMRSTATHSRPAAPRGVLVHEPCPLCGTHPRPIFHELTHAPVHIGRQWPTAEAARRCPRGDIRLSFCRRCGLVQNEAFDPKRAAYGGPYDNALGFSSYHQAFTRTLAESLIVRHGIRGKTVLEIGCGAGDFLELLCAAGNNRGVGYDPSPALAPEPPGGGAFQRICGFYRKEYGDHGADLLCCRHVLEHVADPMAFLGEIRAGFAARRQAVMYFEVPNLRCILRDRSFWTIIYEHRAYFSAEALARLFTACRFEVLAVSECYEGQFLGLEARPAPAAAPAQPPCDLDGLASLVDDFAQTYESGRGWWTAYFDQLQQAGRRAALWGAGAKAVSFLEALGPAAWSGPQAPIAAVVDINPRKAGQYLPGSGLPIVAPAALTHLRPGVVVIMNEVYKPEIESELAGMRLAPELVCA